MSNPVMDAELGQVLRLVHIVNALRGRLPPLTHIQRLDYAAWQMVLEMQKHSFRSAPRYSRSMKPAARVKRLGLRPKRLVVRFAFDMMPGVRWNSDDAARRVVKWWLRDATFTAALHDKAYAWCGAAYRNDCFVFILAG